MKTTVLLSLCGADTAGVKSSMTGSPGGSERGRGMANGQTGDKLDADNSREGANRQIEEAQIQSVKKKKKGNRKVTG